MNQPMPLHFNAFNPIFTESACLFVRMPLNLFAPVSGTMPRESHHGGLWRIREGVAAYCGRLFIQA
jgi:hypothetical protein